MGFDQIVSKYSDPLPCDTCRYALSPIGKFSRTRNCFCDKYSSRENMKPNGVLFSNEECKEYEREGNMAEDGGPGSGNWGHKGRPGKVGGSGPGGGSQYRGGRSDIGYFSSKKDWLNGLSGERQQEASKFLKRMDDIRDNDYYDGKKFRGEPIEKYIMQAGSTGIYKQRAKLLDFMSEARNWQKNRDRLLKENLTDEEREIFEYIEKNYPIGDDGYPNSDDNYEIAKQWINLKSKALGGYVEENFKANKGATKHAGYEWYEKNRKHCYSQMEAHMLEAMADKKSFGILISSPSNTDDFIETNKKFVEYMKYGRLSGTKCRYAMQAMSNMRHVMSMEYDPNGKLREWKDFKFTKNMADKLTDDEKKRFLDIVNKYKGTPAEERNSIEDITSDDLTNAEYGLQMLQLAKKEDQQEVRDFVLFQEKMFTGEVPPDTDPFEEEKKKKKEEEKQKAQARKEQVAKEQKEFLDSPAAEAKQKAIDKIKAFNTDLYDELDRFDLQRAVNGLGFMHGDQKFITNEEVPVEIFRNVAKAYSAVVSRYPFLAGELGGFGNLYSNPNALMGCCKEAYEEGKTEVIINNGKFKDAQKSLERHRKGEKDQFYTQCDEKYGAGYPDAIHELGHALQNWLHRVVYGDFVGTPLNKSPYGVLERYGYDNKVATLLKARTCKAFGIEPTVENIKKYASEYASASRKNKLASEIKSNTDSDEFFSECFTELMCCEHPRPFIVEFGKQLDKFIRENGITAMTTATTPATVPKIVRKNKS